jgi:hypothetical protein
MILILLGINYSEPFALWNPQLCFLDYSICLVCHPFYTLSCKLSEINLITQEPNLIVNSRYSTDVWFWQVAQVLR